MQYIEKQKLRLEQIRDRYFRPVIAFPDGHLCHHGDCSIHRAIDIYGTAACTCGFLHDLRILNESLKSKLHPNFYQELCLEDGPPINLSVDELAEREAFLEKHFPKSSFVAPSLAEWKEICIQDWTLIEDVFGEVFRKRKEAEWIEHEEC